MNTRNFNKKHFCRSCEVEWRTIELLKMYRCPTCMRFTSPHSQTEFLIREVKDIVETNQRFKKKLQT